MNGRKVPLTKSKAFPFMMCNPFSNYIQKRIIKKLARKEYRKWLKYEANKWRKEEE